MSPSLFWSSDQAWAVIEPHLPKNQPRARRVDDRRVISGIIHMLKCGGRWLDCPSEYGPSTTVYNPLEPVEPAGHLDTRNNHDFCAMIGLVAGIGTRCAIWTP